MEICLKTYVHNPKEEGSNKFLIGGEIPIDENFMAYEDRANPNNPFADIYRGKKFDLVSTPDFDERFMDLMMKLTLTHGEFDFQKSCNMFDTLSLYKFENPDTHEILNLCSTTMYRLVFETKDIVKYQDFMSKMMAFELDVQHHNFRVNFKSRELKPILFDVSYRASSI